MSQLTSTSAETNR